jgi:hypothetical protein
MSGQRDDQNDNIFWRHQRCDAVTMTNLIGGLTNFAAASIRVGVSAHL